MAYNEDAQTVLDIAANITEVVQAFYVPVVEGTKNINDEGITANLREEWENLEETTISLIEQTEHAWADSPDHEDSDVDMSE